jgi:hypothetical protein
MLDFKEWLQLREESSGGISKEGRNTFVGTYQTTGGRKFDLEFSISNGVAQISYLRARKNTGVGEFKELIPLISKQMKELGVFKVNYNTSLDDKTQGRSRERLFKRYTDLL